MKIHKWEKFNKLNENVDNTISWYEAFDKYVKGQIVVGEIQHNIHYSTYAEGVLLENGYKYVSYGGGCSGEDCNTSYIISPDNVIISQNNW